MTASILIVDDEPEMLEPLVRFFKLDGYEVQGAQSGTEAISRARGENFDLMITDLSMPEMDGISLLKEMKNLSPRTVAIVVTGHASVNTAVEAMKLGAIDYVQKPVSFDELRIVAERALEHKRLKMENQSLKKQLKKTWDASNIIGDHQTMQQLKRMIERVAETDATVLITGESGTGKELVAKAIHAASDRNNAFLVPVNCGAIPEPLLESEMFGHVKGAFSGATTNRTGRFEMANGGTIFLDEIGHMAPALQVKLLRVIQEREFQPVGSSKTRYVDVRIVAATNADLEKEVAGGGFREDLYYRINVVPIHVAPLRERRTDIPLLVNAFIERCRKERNRDIRPPSDEVVGALMAYDWPGNVRELENLIERLVILSDDGRIKLADLPEKIHRRMGIQIPGSILIPEDGLDFNGIVGDLEDRLILAALEKTGGNKNFAARLLGLKRTTLVEKIKKKGIDLNGEEDGEEEEAVAKA
ncbi:sigma-54 dependent transcriptional regulator [bacterium]|nr:sigma-54 dependent transcriptional regulator [bacterium]